MVAEFLWIPHLLAGMAVSTGFLVVAWIAIAVALLFIVSGLFGPGLRYKIAATRLHRSREALIASDHLRLVAEFEVGKAKE